MCKDLAGQTRPCSLNHLGVDISFKFKRLATSSCLFQVEIPAILLEQSTDQHDPPDSADATLC